MTSNACRGSKNPSLQVTADHKIKLVEAPIESPGPDQVLLHVKATGICGSDIHFWKTGAIGPLVVESDCILGHEAAGQVLQCGEDVTNLKPGDRVAIEPGVPCMKCFLCVKGDYNLCEDVQFAGVYPYHGTIQRFKVHSARFCHKLPDSMSYAEGALVEPLSVVMHGISRAGLSLGQGVLVCGAGPIGLTALASARASGAQPLVITDLEPGRLEFAKKFVPGCKTYLIDKILGPQENAAKIRELFGPTEYEQPPVVLECTGVQSSIVTGIFTVRRSGLVMVIGVGRPIINEVPFMYMSLAEIDLKFINRYHDTWPRGISCFEGGILDLRKLITHTFPLERALEAFDLCADVTKGSIKIQIIDEQDVEPARSMQKPVNARL